MNFCQGVALAEGGVKARDGSTLAGSLPQEVAGGEAAIAAVRPERVVLFPADDIHNRTTGTVEALAYHGLDLQLHVRTKLADKSFLVRITADTADRRKIAVGDAVEIGWAAADTRIFRN
jgi:ABC-type Fe3+/spermidine/putrescine transport system ATPase subunit